MTSVFNKYFKVGEVFTDEENNIKLECSLAGGWGCLDCFYDTAEILCTQENTPECRYYHRRDNKDVVFKVKGDE